MNPQERAARRGKLPAWAREEIRVLEMRLSEARAAAEEITVPDADAYTDPYGDFPKPVAQNGEAVRFPFDGIGGYLWIDVRRRGEVLELMASRSLLIVPQVSNVIRVGVEER